MHEWEDPGHSKGSKEHSTETSVLWTLELFEQTNTRAEDSHHENRAHVNYLCCWLAVEIVVDPGKVGTGDHHCDSSIV